MKQHEHPVTEEDGKYTVLYSDQEIINIMQVLKECN